MKKFACIFPGQGSQAVGMANHLMGDPLSADVFQETNQALGFNLVKVMVEGPEEDLTLTVNAQPAILATSFAAWKHLIRALGGDAICAYVAGHSLGEFTALAATGALELKSAIKLVRKRGQLMQTAVPTGEGAMAALLGGDEEDGVRRLLGVVAEGDALDIANLNSPGQTVISGAATAVKRAMEKAEEFGFKRAVELNVSAPFHSRLMAPAREKFAEELKDIKFMVPFCPVIHNVTAQPNTDPLAMPDLLARQVESPVRWVETVRYMLSRGVEAFVEVGHGTVLQGLVKKIAGKDFGGLITGFSTPEDASWIREALE